jgi:hypothetical protein
MDSDIELYLESSQPRYKEYLDGYNLNDHPIIVALVKAFKQTPWYLNGWKDLAYKAWFD